MVKNRLASAGDIDSIPGSGRSPEEGNGNPLQCSCLAKSMDSGAWQATLHGVAKELDTTERLNNNKNVRHESSYPLPITPLLFLQPSIHLPSLTLLEAELYSQIFHLTYLLQSIILATSYKPHSYEGAVLLLVKQAVTQDPLISLGHFPFHSKQSHENGLGTFLW